jgi:hypothetical protein
MLLKAPIAQELMTPSEAAKWFRRSPSWLRQQRELLRLAEGHSQPLFHVGVCRAYVLGRLSGLDPVALRQVQLRALAAECRLGPSPAESAEVERWLVTSGDLPADPADARAPGAAAAEEGGRSEACNGVLVGPRAAAQQAVVRQQAGTQLAKAPPAPPLRSGSQRCGDGRFAGGPA